jgi:predicted permease
LVLGRIIGIFAIVFLGFGANKIGWIPIDASKYISKIVVNIAAPCVVISTISEQVFTISSLKTLGIICILYLGQYLFQFIISLISVKILKVPRRERGVFSNCYLYTNNGFMGFPVTYAIFGAPGMFYMVIINILMPFLMYTHGVFNLLRDVGYTSHRHGAEKDKKIRLHPKEILTPPVIASLIGLVIYFFHIPVHEQLRDLLDVIGAMMTPLSMIVIGLQLTESSPRRVMLNYRLIVMMLFRLAIMPAVFIGVALLFDLDPLLFGVLTLNIMLPCAALPVSLAEEYGADATLAAEGTFLTTLFSMATIPVAGIVLSSML